MPVNETGKVLIHKGRGNMIIQPGQWYDGPEIGLDGDYVHLKNPAKEGVARATPSGAQTQSDVLSAPSALKNMNKAALADVARARDLPVPEDLEEITKTKLLELLESTR